MSATTPTPPLPATWPKLDWDRWEPQQECVLLFVIENGQVLLIEKKTGFGRGKVNGPGGKIDPGETALAAAIRETQEEIHVTPTGIVPAGELRFHFADGYAMRCQVFRADGHTGTPAESAEAKPFWAPLNAVPFDAMWQDDRHWFPFLLDRRPFLACFTFDGDTMLTKTLHADDA
ncbi:MAG: 8-oxo-dGTP diphosphatase [Verrucomicrobiota bacterium]